MTVNKWIQMDDKLKENPNSNDNIVIWIYFSSYRKGLKFYLKCRLGLFFY